MFRLPRQEQKSSKCYFTHSVLPAYVDERKPPTKKKPFSTILEHAFPHTVDLALPSAIYEIVQFHLDKDAAIPRYSRVFMTLSDIISGDFFNKYIKIGNIIMLSEGRPGVDNTFSLKDGMPRLSWLFSKPANEHAGILRLEVDKPTYERCGLVGKLIPDGGRKHVKSRFAIELNLRLPSMLHGKKGFERIVYASKNVLNHSLTWLFVDLNAKEDSEPGPISQHHPFNHSSTPEITRLSNVALPSFQTPSDLCSPDHAEQFLEWLGLLFLNSDRVRANDSIDSYLCQYEVPHLDRESMDNPENPKTLDTGNVVILRWHGFMSPAFITKVWVAVWKGLKAQDGGWAAVNVSCFGGRAYTVYSHGAQETLTWECD